MKREDHLMYDGMLLSHYLAKTGRRHLYNKVRYAIDHNHDNVPTDELVRLVLEGKRKRNKCAFRKQTHKTNHAFDAKYSCGDKSMYSLLKGNDYFACRRYLLRHPDCDQTATIERFARLGRLRMRMIDIRESDPFGHMTVDGENVRSRLTESEFRRFATFMKRHPKADWHGVYTMVKAGAKQLKSSRMWRGITILCALNGSRNDTMLVKQYARYHKCDDDTAMERVAQYKGWKFGNDNIRIISGNKEGRHGKQV